MHAFEYDVKKMKSTQNYWESFFNLAKDSVRFLFYSNGKNCIVKLYNGKSMMKDSLGLILAREGIYVGNDTNFKIEHLDVKRELKDLVNFWKKNHYQKIKILHKSI